jgi:DNA polymerase-3 subunit delta
VNACQTFPFLSEKRIVILKGLDKMPSGEQEKLVSYLQNPSPSTFLLITAEKIDLRKKICQAIQAHGAIVSCTPPYESQIPFWIKKMAESINLGLSDEAIIELKEQLGNDLLKIQTELEKISLYHLGKKETLNRDDITVVLVGEKEHSIFDLTRAIGQKDFETAMKTLKRVLENGDHPLMVLTFLIRQFRLIWKTKDLFSNGVPKEEISKKLGVHPFYGQTLQNQARLYSEEKLQESFMMFKEADAALKESFHNPRFFLERLIFFLCQPTKNFSTRGGKT